MVVLRRPLGRRSEAGRDVHEQGRHRRSEQAVVAAASAQPRPSRRTALRKARAVSSQCLVRGEGPRRCTPWRRPILRRPARISDRGDGRGDLGEGHLDRSGATLAPRDRVHALRRRPVAGVRVASLGAAGLGNGNLLRRRRGPRGDRSRIPRPQLGQRGAGEDRARLVLGSRSSRPTSSSSERVSTPTG
jgi:hypothetical protein